MFFTSVSGLCGAAAGLGFGIFAATHNFNPQAHQASTLPEAAQIFSELLSVTGTSTSSRTIKEANQ